MFVSLGRHTPHVGSLPRTRKESCVCFPDPGGGFRERRSPAPVVPAQQQRTCNYKAMAGNARAVIGNKYPPSNCGTHLAVGVVEVSSSFKITSSHRENHYLHHQRYPPELTRNSSPITHSHLTIMGSLQNGDGQYQGLGQDFTKQVIASMGSETNPRLREILTSFIQHIHDFAREVDLTTDEWMMGVNMINWAGQMSNDRRNEGQLLCDVIGLES